MLVWIALALARGKVWNSQSRDHLSRVSPSISEVDTKHRRRFQSPSYRAFYRGTTVTVLRGGGQLYPADPLAVKGEIGSSAFTCADADFSPAAAKECQTNITVATSDRISSNKPKLVVEEGVDGERGYAQTAASSSPSKLTAQESLGYRTSTSDGIHSKHFVGMDENQELKTNGNEMEVSNKLPPHDSFGFPRPQGKADDEELFPTHQLVVKCVHHDDRVVVPPRM